MILETMVVRLDASISGFEKAMDRAHRRVARFGDRITSMGTTVTMATAPLAALGAVSIAAATRLDSLTRGLTAVAGSSGEAERQLERLREVAKLPGIGFRQAVQGSINLQVVGRSAEEAAEMIEQFGNALAVTGGGAAELDRVITQITQMSAAGKVLTADLRPIIQTAPLVGAAMKEAFGTISPDEIGKMGIASEEFITRLVAQLAKMPRAAAGAQNSIDNMKDALEEAAASIGKVLLPAFTALAGKVSDFAGWVSQLNPELVRHAAAFGAVTLAVGPLLVALGLLIATLAALKISLLAVVPFLAVGGLLVAGATVLVDRLLKTDDAAGGAAVRVRELAGAMRTLESATKGELLTSIETLYARLEELRSRPLIDADAQRQIAALTMQLDTLRAAYTRVDDAAAGGGGGGGGGAALNRNLATTLENYRRISDEVDGLRERLASLNVQAFTARGDEATRVAESIAEANRELALYNAELDRMAGKLMAFQTPALGDISTTFGIDGGIDLTPLEAALAPVTSELEKARAVLQSFTDTGTSVNDVLPALREQFLAAGKTVEEWEQAQRENAAALEKAGVADAFDALGMVAGRLEGTFGQVAKAAHGLHAALVQGGASGIAEAGLGFAIQVADALMGGDSPEKVEQARIQRSNTQAIERLNEGIARLGDVLRNTAGSDLAAMEQALVRLGESAEYRGLLAIGRGLTAFDKELSKVGLTLDDARSVASGLGITLDSTAASLSDFLVALRQYEMEQFFSSFTGRLDMLRRRFELFDVEEPAAKLEEMRDLFVGSLAKLGMRSMGEGQLDWSTIADGLGEFDLSSAVGLAAFEDKLRALFEGLRTGEIESTELGELSVSGFLDMIAEMERLADEVAGTADGFAELQDAMRNVPTGFKVTLARFNASGALDVGGIRTAAAAPTAAPTTLNIQRIDVHGVQNPEEFFTKLERVARDKKMAGGTIMLS